MGDPPTPNGDEVERDIEGVVRARWGVEDGSDVALSGESS